MPLKLEYHWLTLMDGAASDHDAGIRDKTELPPWDCVVEGG